MTDLAELVTDWLRNTWGVTVPNDWLEACIEWIDSENESGVPVSSSDVCSMVFEQWLVCDLRTIGASCLPPDVASHSKLIINNSCGLQIISMVDVSCSFYEQQQKATGTVNSNVLVTASTQSTQQQQNEAKGNRMIVMKVTDGSQDIQAMEYRLIPTLKANLPPGTKIVVHPGAMCRSGMLMLAPDSVSILGGEVESLTGESGVKVIGDSLRHNLELTQRHVEQPRVTFNSSGGVERSSRNSGSSALASRHLPRPSAPNPPRAQPPRPSLGQTSTPISRPPPRHMVPHPPPRVQPPGDAQYSSGRPATHTNTMTECTDDQLTREDAFDDDIPDEDLMMIADDDDDDPTSWSTGASESIAEIRSSHDIKSSSSRSVTNNSLLDDSVFRRPDSTLPISSKSNQSHTSSTSSTNRGSALITINKKRKSEDLSSIKLDDVDFDDDFEPMPSFSSQPKSKSSCISKSSFAAASSKDDRGGGVALITLTRSDEDDVKCDKLTSRTVVDNLELERSTDSISRHSNTTSSTLESSNRLQSRQGSSGTHSDTSANRPFTYLAKALANRKHSASQTVCVKAYVSTLLSRLEHGRGSRWSLTAKINDGTAAVDVQLTDSVLSQLIGFSASECGKMKVAAKSDVVVRSKLEQGLKQCQTKLIQLSCILELSITSDIGSLPQVLSLRDVTMTDVERLKNL